ncbi:hypothetical protein HDK77DRAFT_501285 [Phyllosticta capitalensis]|uniref:Uncharacterized protein n=1 Tax=Phyllosticta capitalensis TaxID=121624 RepID=A0ABR1YCZ9_9PEZI
MLTTVIFLIVSFGGLVYSRAASLSISASLKHASKEAYYERNLRTVQAIYNLTVYPNNAPIVAQGGPAVPPGLFNPEAKGRVTPLGNFTTFEESIEYFFALAPIPSATPAKTGIYRADLVSFVTGCPEIAASVVYLRTGTVDPQTAVHTPGPMDTTLKQVAFWRFDSEGAVLRYDAWIPSLRLWTAISSGIDYNNPQVQQGTIVTALCPQIQQRCVGPNQVYASVEDCSRQLLAKPFGDFDEVWADNIVCRIIHLILTGTRPDIHCPHVGPTGGGKCVDNDYSIYYFDDLELLGSDKPFYCAEDDWADYLIKDEA